MGTRPLSYLLAAQTAGKPVCVLFQEVPGFQACVSFGEQVLRHPLLVEAIETAFEPAFVYNTDRVRMRRSCDATKSLSGKIRSFAFSTKLVRKSAK